MINAPDPNRIFLHLRIAAAGIEYFFSSVWLGIEIFYHYTLLSAEGRMLAQDMRASLYGELRDQITDQTVHRINRMCASWRRGTRVCDKANSVIRFIVEPVRRNLVENCEMLEDVAARLNQAADAEASGSEQDPPAERESDA